MSADPTVFLSQRVLTPEGLHAAGVAVRDGRIEAVLAPGDVPGRATVEDLGDAVLMPGVVDTHVHVNEPGRTEWEGFATATRAAATGGITTLVDMPLNSSPVTTTLGALDTKRAAAAGQCHIDVGFWGGVVPGNASELEPMIDAGICGFKAFLTHSGIDDFPNASEADLRQAMPILARRGIPLLVHAELDVPVPAFGGPPGDKAAPAVPAESRRYADFLASRPAAWEEEAIKLMIRLCRETGCAVHVVHLSAASALPLIAQAKAEGLPFTVETCPHYMVFAAEEIPDGATEYKCAPPIREKANREALWAGLRSGVIDFVACDHSPCTPGLKLPETGDFMNAWGGIASLQFSLSVVWTHAKERGFGIEALLPWLCERTARFAGLPNKGAIAPGFDADLVVWRPEASFTIEAAAIRHRHPVTPYLGRSLHGVVERTYLRGRPVYDRGRLAPEPVGRLLSRNETEPSWNPSSTPSRN